MAEATIPYLETLLLIMEAISKNGERQLDVL